MVTKVQMRIKRELIVGILIIMLMTLTGCGEMLDKSTQNINREEGMVYIENLNSDLEGSGNFALYYDNRTKIVYLYDDGSCLNGFCPYISEEGTYVRYVDDNFVNVN